MWFNVPIAAILRSPLHGLLSRSVILITVKGRKSGRAYTTPVNYSTVGNELWTVSFRERTWWRNLRGGAPVTIRLRGRTIAANADVVEAVAEVQKCLADLIEKAPGYGRVLGIRRLADGRPEAESVRDAAQSRVVVKVRPS